MALNIVIDPEAVPKLKSVHFSDNGQLVVEYLPSAKKASKKKTTKKSTRKRTSKKKSTK